jgi:16S rRNA (cytosine967-C5)-methyltransferase
VIQSYKEIKNSPIQYDFIWIDAPCSSTGIIRRHPEVKWNRTEKEIEKLFATQSELVDWAFKHLKEDGAILYSTCSVIAKENEPTLPAGLDCAQSWSGSRMWHHLETLF